MKHVCLLVVLFLATVGPTTVIGQNQPTFIEENQRRLLTLAPDSSEGTWHELATGNELLARCEHALGEQPGPRDTSAASGCRSLVRGVLGMTGLARGLRVCSPAEATVIEAVRVVVSYLNAHPEERHEQDFMLTLRALRQAFPCQ